MKITRKILTALLCLAMLASMVVSVSAEEATLDAAGLYSSDRWVTRHNWEFKGNVKDTVGNVEPTPYTSAAIWKEPTYKDNEKIVLTGNSVYYFEYPLTFADTEDLKYMRIDIKCKLDWSVVGKGQGAQRIFGSWSNATNIVNVTVPFAADAKIPKNWSSGFYITGMPGQGNMYNSGAFYLQGTDAGHSVYKIDKEAIDMNEEHLWTVIFYEGNYYYYCDGEFQDKVTQQGTTDYIFSDFLGCTFTPSTTNNNFTGEIDYIKISKLGNKSPEPSTDTTAPAPVVGSSESTPGGTTDTGDVMIALPVAIIAVASVAVVASRKKKND